MALGTAGRLVIFLEIMTTVGVLSWLATVFTIGFFLAGILTCKTIIQNGNTDNVPFLPFLTTVLNCLMWVSYGYLKDDGTLIVVNFSGAFLQVVYIICYLMYSRQLRRELSRVLFALVVCVCLYLYIMVHITESSMRVSRLGNICVFVTVMMQASPLASMAKVLKNRSTESLPFPFILMLTLVSSIWLAYGYTIGDTNIQIPNASGVILGVCQLSLFCIYPATSVRSL